MTNIESREDSPSKPKSIVGLNFRQIVDSLDEHVNLQEGSNLYFVEDAFPSNVEKESISIKNRVKKSLNLLSSKVGFVRFLMDLGFYIASRTRILIVLTGVFSEVVSNQFEMVKRYMIRKMFWGRSNLFRFSVQMLGTFILAVILIAGGYRSNVVDAGFEFIGDTINPSYQVDRLVQNSSTRTLAANPDFGRVKPEKYIVKGGDTLSSIAANFGLNLETILWANDLTRDSLINPGMELDIPPGNGIVITVDDNDTLDSIAEKYEANKQVIAEWNWIDPPFIVQEGDVLFIPDGRLPIEEQPSTVGNAPIFTGIVSPPPAPIGGGGGSANLGRFLGWPAPGAGLSQCYTGFHNGVDIAGPLGTTLVAAAPGTVTFAGCQSGNCPPPGQATGGWGLAWTVVIDHGNGYSSVYGHMNSIAVSTGQGVSAGQGIGTLGMSGLATGPHVHFMLVHSGTWSHINPAPYMTTSVCGY